MTVNHTDLRGRKATERGRGRRLLRGLRRRDAQLVAAPADRSRRVQFQGPLSRLLAGPAHHSTRSRTFRSTWRRCSLATRRCTTCRGSCGFQGWSHEGRTIPVAPDSRGARTWSSTTSSLTLRRACPRQRVSRPVAPALPRGRATAALRLVSRAKGARGVAQAPEGDRNNTVHEAAVRLGSLVGAGMLAEADARDALLLGVRAADNRCPRRKRKARSTAVSSTAGSTRGRSIEVTDDPRPRGDQGFGPGGRHSDRGDEAQPPPKSAATVLVEMARNVSISASAMRGSRSASRSAARRSSTCSAAERRRFVANSRGTTSATSTAWHRSRPSATRWPRWRASPLSRSRPRSSSGSPGTQTPCGLTSVAPRAARSRSSPAGGRSSTRHPSCSSGRR
jgi:hypothetical protein